MLIFALDAADRCGWAFGEAGTIPASGAVRLKKPNEDTAIAAGNMHCFLRDMVNKYGRPDILAPEHYLNPQAHQSDTSIISQLLKHGAIYGFAGDLGLKVVSPDVGKIRTHFCGQRTASVQRFAYGIGGVKTKRKRTKKEAEEDRRATNIMVLNRAIVLGYIPVEAEDFDRANACAVFDYVSANYARKVRPLALFGQVPAKEQDEQIIDF